MKKIYQVSLTNKIRDCETIREREKNYDKIISFQDFLDIGFNASHLLV